MALDGILRRNQSEGRRAGGGRWAGWRVLVSALVLLLGAGGGRDAAAAEKVPAFTYEQYCDAQGHFKYDGAALKLVKRPARLKQVYENAAREDARAKVLVGELEYWFRQAGLVVADTTTRPACLLPKEMTPECQPNWQFLTELLGDTPEAQRLRQVVVNAYEERARERGLQNQVIMAGVNLLLAGGMAKGLVTRAAAVEARGAAGQSLAAEARAAQADARAASGSGVAARGQPASGEVIAVDPSKLRWFQTTAGGRGRADALRASMRERGWSGDPIDVVATSDGLVTIDHTRAAVALELGMKSIPARVHLPVDPLPAEMLSRPWNSLGQTATTWGEAAALRGAGQVPPIGPTGTPLPPRLPKPGGR